MRPPVSRRSFLLASAGVVAGVALGACGGGDEDDDVSVSPQDTAGSGSGSGATPRDLSLVVASYVHVTGVDERVTLAFIQGNGPYRASAPVSFKVDGQAVEAARYDEGITLPYYLLRRRFDTPGVKTVEATLAGRTLQAALTVGDGASAKIPVQGQPMKRLRTPTTADGLGVNPICTKRPGCPLHEVSLDAALDEKKPLAVLFATPALCQSQLCGPVLENLLAVRDQFADRVRMLHVEIYTDMSGKTLAAPVKELGLEAEPFLFLVGADGVVRERLDNAYDRREVREALTRLTA